MKTDESTQGDRGFPGKSVDTTTISMPRRVLVYVLLATIVGIMIGYCLLLVVTEELAQNRFIQILVLIYPFVVGLTSLACIAYTHMTSYVSEFKIGWTLVIATGALLSLSAFVLPTFWYLQVWTPFRGKSPASAEEAA